MTKEERELFLNFVDGKRKYNRSKNFVVKKVSKSKGRHKNAIYVYSMCGLEDKREFPYPFIKEMKTNRFYTINEIINFYKENEKWREGIKIMNIKNITKSTNQVNMTLEKDELVMLCNVMYRAEEAGVDEIKSALFHKLYADLIMVTNLCQYGHVDDFTFNLIMDERKYAGLKKFKRLEERLEEKQKHDIVNEIKEGCA